MRQWQISALRAQTASSHFKLQPSTWRINITPQQWKAKDTGKGGQGKWSLQVSFPLLSHCCPRSSACLYPGQLAVLYLGFQCELSCRGSQAPAVACRIWESLNHRRVGICVEGQAGASAWHWMGVLTYGCPEWQRRNWFAFRGSRTTAARPFFRRLPPTGKLKKNRRSPQETQFIFLSASSHFSFLLSTHIKKKFKKKS